MFDFTPDTEIEAAKAKWDFSSDFLPGLGIDKTYEATKKVISVMNTEGSECGAAITNQVHKADIHWAEYRRIITHLWKNYKHADFPISTKHEAQRHREKAESYLNAAAAACVAMLGCAVAGDWDDGEEYSMAVHGLTKLGGDSKFEMHTS